jgi:Aspartyl/Asparaginyl beta-hydroxylase
MENFLKIAEGLEVAPALSALARLNPIYWTNIMSPTAPMVLLLGPDGRRRHTEALAEIWSLVEEVHARAVGGQGDRGAICYVRVGRLPPGDRVAPHADGHDGVVHRRYQIVLASGPKAAIVLGGEARSLGPGEAWQMDTSKIHWAENHDAVERVTIVFDTQAQDCRGAPAPNPP